MKKFELYDFIMKACDEFDAFPEIIDTEDVSSWETAARQALFESYRHAPGKDVKERIRQAGIAIHKACEDFTKSQPRPANGLEALKEFVEKAIDDEYSGPIYTDPDVVWKSIGRIEAFKEVLAFIQKTEEAKE